MDLALTLGPLRRGRYDPTCQIGAAGLWRATRTPEGAATLAVVARDGPSRTQGTTFDATAWGAGAEWALDHAPALLGAEDTVPQTVEVGSSGGQRGALGIPAVDATGEIRSLEDIEADIQRIEKEIVAMLREVAG